MGEFFFKFLLPFFGLPKEGRDLYSRDVSSLRVSLHKLLRLRWCLLGFSTVKLGFFPWQHQGRLRTSQHCESIFEYIPAPSPHGSLEWPVQQAFRQAGGKLACGIWASGCSRSAGSYELFLLHGTAASRVNKRATSSSTSPRTACRLLGEGRWGMQGLVR